MKVLLINPPLGTFASIYASVPILLGQLNANNIDSAALDMNIEFLKEITSSEYLKYTKELLKKIYKDNKILNNNVNQRYHLTSAQLEQLNKKIKEFLTHHIKTIDFFVKREQNFFDEYKEAIYNNNRSENEYKKYLKIFYSLISFAFLPFYPEEPLIKVLASAIPIAAAQNPIYKYTYEDIIDKCSNRLRNIYIKIFEKKIKEHELYKYDIIGITIPFEQNTYPALTLSKLLKENTNSKVVIGGIIPTTTIDGFINHPEMFGTFFDYVLTGDGEESIVNFTKYIENKISADDVSGMVYKKGNAIKRNNLFPINIKNVYPPNYSGINFNNYINKNYIALEFAKGCYWHKCTFCYNNLWKRYYIKNPAEAVDIIQNLKEKYKADWFDILDDALNINFAEKFADEIIKRGLKIKYICFLRAEEALTYKILKKLKNSGLEYVFFGIESASERILKLMNKGINTKTAERILKDCHDIGINAAAGFIYGFPTETEKDILKTIKFIKKNKKYIQQIHNFMFHITKSSAMLTKDNIKKFQLTNIKQPEEFSDNIEYNAPGTTKKRIHKILKKNKISTSEHTKWF